MTNVLDFNKAKLQKITNGHTTDPRTLALFLGLSAMVHTYQDIKKVYPKFSVVCVKDTDLTHKQLSNNQTLDPSLWFSKSPDVVECNTTIVFFIDNILEHTLISTDSTKDTSDLLKRWFVDKLIHDIKTIKKQDSFVLLNTEIDSTFVKDVPTIILHVNNNHKIVLQLYFNISSDGHGMLHIQLNHIIDIKQAFGENEDVLYSIDCNNQIHGMLENQIDPSLLIPKKER